MFTARLNSSSLHSRKSALVERVCTAFSAVFNLCFIPRCPLHRPYGATTENRSGASRAFRSIIQRDARALSRAVGELRDADVLIEDIYAPVAGNPPRKPGFDALHEALQAHRGEVQRGAREALRGEHWSRLLLALSIWPQMLEREPCLQIPVEDGAGEALQTRWKKVSKLGRKLKSLDPAQQHKMRRSLKKLRYLAEFFAPVFPEKDAAPFIKRLKKLQDVFGYVNDVRMSERMQSICEELCDREPAASFAAGFICGRHEGAAAEV